MAIPAYILSPLVDVLAELYSDPASARALAQTAGLAPGQIPLDPRATNSWVFLLNEAEAQDRTSALLERAKSQYPVEKRLATASQAYADWVAAGRPAHAPPRPQPLPTTTVADVPSARGQLFLSYSRHDRDYVERLAADLQAHGYGTWYDDRIDLGHRWWRTIEKAIETCAAMVVVMSPEARESEWVEREILLAQQEGKTILPLLLRGNVWEWTQTKWRNDYKTPAANSPEGNDARVVRGGSFINTHNHRRQRMRAMNGRPRIPIANTRIANDEGVPCLTAQPSSAS